MKSKKLSVVLKNGTRKNSTDLLVTDMGVLKDIVKDIIGNLPNVLALETKSAQIQTILPGGTTSFQGTLTAFACFELRDVKTAFMDIIKYDGAETVDDKQEPVVKYDIYVDTDNDYAEAIFQMIEHYYSDKDSASVHRYTESPKSHNGGAENNIEVVPISKSNWDGAYPAAYAANKNGFDDDTKHITIMSIRDDQVDLDNKHLIDRVIEIIRTQYAVILPCKSETISESVDDDTERKTFMDTYNVYAMDTSIGLLFKLVSCTSSTIGKSSQFRNNVVNHDVLITFIGKIPTYAADLEQHIINTLSKQIKLKWIYVTP